VFLDDLSAAPVLAAAERLGVPVYLHPAEPPAAVRAAYFAGLEPEVAGMPATPFSLARADERLSPVAKGLSAAVGDTVLQHVHVTTCGCTTSPPLLCALLVFGADRMLFSVDYPCSDSSQGAALLREAPVSPADKEKIAHGNAERLLRL